MTQSGKFDMIVFGKTTMGEYSSMSHYKHLSINEREMILRLTCEKKSLQAIAKSIGRPVSTVSRELKRNGTSKGYSAVDANRQYQTRRKKCSRTKLLENSKLKHNVMHLFLA